MASASFPSALGDSRLCPYILKCHSTVFPDRRYSSCFASRPREHDNLCPLQDGKVLVLEHANRCKGIGKKTADSI